MRDSRTGQPDGVGPWGLGFSILSLTPREGIAADIPNRKQ